MKMKKILAVALVAVLAISGVFAGGASETAVNADGKYAGIELTMWSMWNSAEPQGKVIQQAADAFAAETGCKINIEWKGRDVNTIILTALESGEKVDIFEDDYKRIGQTYKDYCLDLTQLAADRNYAAQSYACFADVATGWSGFLSSIAEQPQVGGIFYNKDIFEACGIEIPETWDEFLAACQTMVDNGYQPMALDSTYSDFFFGYHLDRRIGEAATHDLTMNGGWANNAGAIAAADDIIAFRNAGYLADGAPDEYPSSQNKIGLTGKVAMVVCANYVAPEVNNTTGTIVNWGMFNYPTISVENGGSGSTNAYAGANSLAIAKYTEHPDAAIDFCLFLTSGEWDQKMADEAQQIPADPSNVAPAIMDGTVEALLATKEPLSWSMGLGDNSAIKANLKSTVIQLFEGKFSTGLEFCQALDKLY